jgi:hypothetical protein
MDPESEIDDSAQYFLPCLFQNIWMPFGFEGDVYGIAKKAANH